MWCGSKDKFFPQKCREYDSRHFSRSGGSYIMPFIDGGAGWLEEVRPNIDGNGPFYRFDIANRVVE
jgi:hypothetical protein